MKSNYKNIDDANNKIDSIIKQFEICKEQIQKENQELQNKLHYWQTEHDEIFDKNEKQDKIIISYRNQFLELREDIGTYENQYNKLIEENEQLKQRISNLVSENTKLQNDLFSEQLDQDETEDYINKLKKERKWWITEYKNFNEKCSKLSNELSLKIRHEHMQTLEINELKRELKEYRGF